MEIYKIKHKESGEYVKTYNNGICNVVACDEIDAVMFRNIKQVEQYINNTIRYVNRDGIKQRTTNDDYEIITFSLIEVNNTVAQGQMAEVFNHKMFGMSFHSDI